MNGGLFRSSLSPPPGAPVALENILLDGGALLPTSWSVDGARLAGPIMSPTGRSLGVGVYDLAAKAVRRVADDPTIVVRWLSDSRRMVYFTPDEVVLFDTAASRRTVLDVRLPLPAAQELFAVAPDDRAIYYGGIRSEADIWIVERE